METRIRLTLAKETTDKLFIETGVVPESTVTLEIPVTSLSKQAREAMTTWGLSVVDDTWITKDYVGALPNSIEEWDALILGIAKKKADKEKAEFREKEIWTLRSIGKAKIAAKKYLRGGKGRYRFLWREEYSPYFYVRTDRCSRALERAKIEIEKAKRRSESIERRIDWFKALESAQKEAKDLIAERMKEQRREKLLREKIEWVAVHGSDFLKSAVRDGYPCRRRYLEERVALEFPGFKIDFSGDVELKPRKCPSETAYELSKEVGGRVFTWSYEDEWGERYSHEVVARPPIEWDSEDDWPEYKELLYKIV